MRRKFIAGNWKMNHGPAATSEFFSKFGAELKDAVESIPQDIAEHLHITYSPCLGNCEGLRPPFIEINGKRIAGVSKTNLLQIIKDEIRNAV